MLLRQIESVSGTGVHRLRQVALKSPEPGSCEHGAGPRGDGVASRKPHLVAPKGTARRGSGSSGHLASATSKVLFRLVHRDGVIDEGRNHGRAHQSQEPHQRVDVLNTKEKPALIELEADSNGARRTLRPGRIARCKAADRRPNRKTDAEPRPIVLRRVIETSLPVATSGTQTCIGVDRRHYRANPRRRAGS